MKQIVCVSGHAGAGKDFFSSMLSAELTKRDNKVLICHYADLVKYVCEKFFGWNGLKDVSGRTLLQKIGTDVIRKKNPNYWVDFLCDIFLFFPDEWDYIIISDLRFPNEYNRIRERVTPNVMSVLIQREKESEESEHKLTEKQKNHSSETSMNDFPFTVTICNNYDISAFHETAKDFAEYLINMDEENKKGGD